MTAQYQVLVVGGGVVGCNILHHLTLEGSSDIALCERKELTAGATWHSSGHISCYTPSPLLTEFAAYMRGLLMPLVLETGQEIGLRETGSIRLAADEAAYTRFQEFVDTPAGQSVGARMISVEDVQPMWPLMESGGFVGALHIPADCHLNAADLTQALSKAARAKGATVKRETEVTGLSQNAGGDWTVETSQGRFTAQHVVFATGIFARRTFRQFGINLPSAAVSHQYLVTETVPEVQEYQARTATPLPILRQPSNGMNVREEGDGLFISLYEQNAKAIWPKGPPGDFGMELFPEDFESIEPSFLDAIARVPSLGRAGIKSVVHGPMPWSPDFAPIVGPIPGHRGLWVAECASYGVIWSGGIARALARWIVHGEPGQDCSEIDCRRFGSFVSDEWSDQRAVRMYKGVYGTGDRPLASNRSPLHAILSDAGAEFDEIYGIECAVRFGSGNLSDFLSHQAGSIQLRKSLLHEPAPSAIFRISGAGAHHFIEEAMEGEVPEIGNPHTVMTRLSKRGTIDGLYRVRRSSDDAFELIGETSLERREEDIFQKQADGVPEVILENLSQTTKTLVFITPDGLDSNLKNSLEALGARLLRLENMGAAEHWLSVHSEDNHLAVHDALIAGLGRDHTAYIGTSDYADMRNAFGHLVKGTDISGNTRPDGVDDSTETQNICVLTVYVGADAKPLRGALVFDNSDVPIGRVTSAVALPPENDDHTTKSDWRIIGYFSKHGLDGGTEKSIRIGQVEARVKDIHVPKTVLPLS